MSTAFFLSFFVTRKCRENNRIRYCLNYNGRNEACELKSDNFFFNSALSWWTLKNHSCLFAYQRAKLAKESSQSVIIYSEGPPNPGAGILISRKPDTGNGRGGRGVCTCACMHEPVCVCRLKADMGKRSGEVVWACEKWGCAALLSKLSNRLLCHSIKRHSTADHEGWLENRIFLIWRSQCKA